MLDLELLASKLGAVIVRDEVSSAAAWTVRRKGYATIRLRADEELRRARFTIAHELGHCLLHREHHELRPRCRFATIGERPSIESEANDFAAELLLPSHILRPRCGRPSLDLIHLLLEEFVTTWTATAVNVVRLTEAPCALVLTEYGKVKWAVTSDAWRGPVVRRRTHLPLESAAAAARTTGSPNARVSGPVEGATWGAGVSELLEDAIAWPEWETTLSLLRSGF
ncbi:MAG: ImmA/IrrE family metallo-endopeptidase [Deltaproteobacteria bacterium]|nr:ImmA/IrrE family metallo-endopeptidase [Deltaproteobacteria bacterium]